jgi:Protein of unknown function (DUF1674)
MGGALNVQARLGKPDASCYGNTMTDTSSKRATKRPDHLKAPAYLSKSPPVPKPKPMVRGEEPDPDRLDPVRYGDWEYKGIAIDF